MRRGVRLSLVHAEASVTRPKLLEADESIDLTYKHIEVLRSDSISSSDAPITIYGSHVAVRLEDLAVFDIRADGVTRGSELCR